MATTWYVQPKGFAATTGAGTLANPFDGTAAVQTALAGGTIVSGDTVTQKTGTGSFTLATEAADWPGPASATTQIGFPNSTGGIYLGSSSQSTSSASGVIFDSWTIDMRGATTSLQRQGAAFKVQGWDITIRKFVVNQSNWNFLCTDNATATTRVSGYSAPEEAYENMGIAVIGGGATIEDCIVDGSSAWGTYGIYVAIPRTGATGGVVDKTTTVRRNSVSHCGMGIYFEVFGGSEKITMAGTNIDCYYNKVFDGVFGRRADLPAGPYNAGFHGNGITCLCRAANYGWVQFSNNEIYGAWQDGIAMNSRFGVVRGNYIHDLGEQTDRHITGTGPYTWTSSANNTEGNGIKIGLANYDATSPTVYLGNDGIDNVNTNSLQVDETAPVVCLNVLKRINYMGITSNNSGRGAMIFYNDIDDTGNDGINLFVSTAATNNGIGNYALVGNFVRKVTSDPTNAALRIQTNCRISLMYDNIFWSNTSNSSQVDGSITTAVALPSTRWKNNLWVTGRKDKGTSTFVYPVGVDKATQTPSWVVDSGLSAGSALIGAGSTERFRYLRATHSFYKLGPMTTVSIANNTTTITVPTFLPADISAPNVGPR